MARPHSHEIRDTPLTWAIRSMRRRLRMGQVKFTKLVLGKYTPGSISRWESGQTVPRAENLLRLLKLAATTEELTPVLDELRARGIDALLAEVQPYLSSNPGNIPVPLNDSIARASEGSNVRIP